MGALGLHLAITKDELDALEAVAGPGDIERRYHVNEELEEKYLGEEGETPFAQETDKSWDAIHRLLTGQPADQDLDPQAGSYPLNQVILGGRSLYERDDYIIRVIEPQAVKDIAAALADWDEERMTAAYNAHCDGAWPEFGEEDCGYTWSWFEPLKEFFARVAPTGRHVLVSISQ